MKLRWKIVIALAVIICVAGLVLHLASSRNRNALEKYKSQLLAQGEKLSYADLAPTAPPPASNGARVFLNVAPTLNSSAAGPPIMKMVAPAVAMVSWREETTRAAAHEEGWTNAWEQLAHELEIKHQGLLGLQDALDSPVLFFDVDYSQGFSFTLLHLPRLKGAEVLVSAAAAGALHDKNYAQAFTCLEMAVALVQKYQAEPTIISHLVKAAMAQIAIGATWEALQAGHLTDAQLAELQSRWQDMDLFGPAEAAFAMERAIGTETFKTLRKSYTEMQSLLSGVSANQSASGAVSGILDDPGEALKNAYERYPRYWAWKSSWSYEEELYNMQVLQAALEMFRQARATGAFVPAYNELRTKATNINQLHPQATSHFLASTVPEVSFGSSVKFADTEVARRLLVAAIALKRYQLHHGSYPRDLNALSPDLLSQVPVDLMDGKPLRYRLQSDGTYLLYSIGEDGVDNGGDPAPTETAPNRTKRWLKGRDIVWPRVATKAEVDAFYDSSPSN